MEKPNSDVDEGSEAAPGGAATNGAGAASSLYDPESPPFEDRPVQSVQDRPAAAAMPAGGFDAEQASGDRKRACAAAGVALVALLFLRRRRRRRRHGRA